MAQSVIQIDFGVFDKVQQSREGNKIVLPTARNVASGGRVNCTALPIVILDSRKSVVRLPFQARYQLRKLRPSIGRAAMPDRTAVRIKDTLLDSLQERDQTFYWRVQGTSANGQKTAWSSTRTGWTRSGSSAWSGSVSVT